MFTCRHAPPVYEVMQMILHLTYNKSGGFVSAHFQTLHIDTNTVVDDIQHYGSQ